MAASYQWGAEGCERLAIGIALTTGKVKAGARLPFRLAIANRSTVKKRVILFSGSEPIYRTRVLVNGVPQGAVRPKVPTLSGAPIAADLAPTQIHERDGQIDLTGVAPGKVRIQLVYGGTAAFACEVRSAEVIVEVA